MTFRPIISSSLDWASVIGRFILNFGVLDLSLTKFLQKRLPEDQAAALGKLGFHDRMQRLSKLVRKTPEMKAREKKFLQFAARVETVRAVRNHIAHGFLSHDLDAERKLVAQTLVLTMDPAGTQMRMDFDELLMMERLVSDLVGELVILDEQELVTVRA